MVSFAALTLFISAIFKPVETDTPFQNPLKGWILIEHALPSEVDLGKSLAQVKDNTAFEWFPHIAVMSTWALVEPEPNKYNWDLLDETINYWSNLGKTIHLRISTEDYGYIPGCPRWLLKLGVPYRTYEKQYFPDYTHPLYRFHLKKFLKTLFEKYGHDTRIETVDLRGYGNWGEWHSGFFYNTVNQRIKALQSIIDLWRETNKKKKLLLLSASYEWQTPTNSGTQVLPHGTSIYEPYPPSYRQFLMRSAFDYALKFPDISLRRDGVGGAVFLQYDGRLLAESFFTLRKPIVTEFFGGLEAYKTESILGYPSTKNGDDHVENAIDEAISHHPNYCVALGHVVKNTVQFYNEYPDLIIRAHMQMGYRFVLIKAEYPDQLTPGGNLPIKHVWENRGAGRCYNPYKLMFYLTQNEVNVWQGIDPLFDLTNLLVGDSLTFRSCFKIPENINEGEYDLKLAIVNNEQKPVIKLAIEGCDANGRYNIGKVHIINKQVKNIEPIFEKPIYYKNIWRLKTQLEPHSHYLLSFSYKILKTSENTLDSELTGFLKCYAENNSHLRVSETRWFDQIPNVSTPKSLLISTLTSPSYTIFWETELQGAKFKIENVSIEKIPEKHVQKLSLATQTLQPSAKITIVQNDRVNAIREPSQVTLPHDWFSFLKTNPQKLSLKPNAIYTVWFYCAAKPYLGQGDYFYLAVRKCGEKDPPLQLPSKFFRWSQRHTSEPLRYAFTFRTYLTGITFLEWGIKNGGECTIFDVCLVKHHDD